MFQLKTKVANNELNPANSNPNALPNNYGRVRTLKEDYEKFVTGKSGTEEAPPDNPTAPANPSPPFQISEDTTSSPPLSSTAPATPVASVPPVMPATPPVAENIPPPFSDNMPKKEEDLPNPLGSQTFYSEKSPFAEAGTSEEKNIPPAPAKSKNMLVIIISAVLAVILLGGGFYYYWFFIKIPSGKTVTPSEKPTPEANQNPAPTTGSGQTNKNLLQLVIDTGAGNESAKSALQKVATDFQSNSSPGDLAEIKVLAKNNSAINAKDLATDLGFSIPEKIDANISGEYSLFIKNENSAIRTGAAFKLSDSSGLADYLSLQEATLPVNFGTFYLNQIPAGAATAFSSSLYKNADIRYFNFLSPENTSFDYSVVSSDQNGYFIFSTSKGTMRSILDYMSTK